MEIDGVEGYAEEVFPEDELDEPEAETPFSENSTADAGFYDPEDSAVVKNPISNIVEDVLEALEGGEAAEEPAAEPMEPEAVLSEDAWQSYLLLQDQQHLELMAHLETIQNLDLCVLVALGVVAGCLLMRQLSSFFR